MYTIKKYLIKICKLQSLFRASNSTLIFVLKFHIAPRLRLNSFFPVDQVSFRFSIQNKCLCFNVPRCLDIFPDIDLITPEAFVRSSVSVIPKLTFLDWVFKVLLDPFESESDENDSVS
ncbi:hypothetical protein BpHYR1_015624 [Brachionus plicatilis]|uniref:Uncharacterized protein n=1 Tax=Brachionus plicatilis TaxID=10195 RepID=A0A3M7RHY3_BRAPC|nr:hypothetical protein BpHYR1_015624 [Brachionus plicatilis]